MENKFCLSKFLSEKECTTCEGYKATLKSNNGTHLTVIVTNPWGYGRDATFLYDMNGVFINEIHGKDVKVDNVMHGFEHFDLINNADVPDFLTIGEIDITINHNKNENTTCIMSVKCMLEDWDLYDFDVLLSNGKPLQRGLVWSEQQKSQYILSLLKELHQSPITIISVCSIDDRFNRYVTKVIDGKQRLNTIKEFCDNKFCITVDSDLYYFSDLTFNCKRRILNTSFIGTRYYEYTSNIQEQNEQFTDEELITLFEHINFLGTPQDITHLEKLKTYIK